MAVGRWRSGFIDGVLILGISVFSAFLSGAQRWTGFNSPDSEFYASLALFGDDVAGRAIDPAYTTTRLGYIAPVRFLTGALGTWTGFAIWRFVLVLAIVGALYGLVRLSSTRPLAVAVALVGSLNTIVMSFVGNTYLTATLVSALLVLLLVGAWRAIGAPTRRWPPAALSGGLLAWLAMVNPYGMFLGLSMWLGLWGVAIVRERHEGWRQLGRDALAAGAGFVVVSGAFLVAGLWIFPGRSWLGTYLDWNARLDYSVFVGDPDVWHRDIALLVPLAAVVLAGIALWLGRDRRPAGAGLLIAGVNWLFTLAYLWLVPGPWLEAPTYVALLWPGALAALALSFAGVVGRESLGWPAWIVGLAALPLVLWSGRSDNDLTGVQGLAVLAALVALFVVAALAARRSTGPSAGGVAIVVSLASIAIGAQLLQNGRGLLGIYGQFPFRAAYVDFQTEDLMRSKVAAQEFVLAQTTPDDTVGVWADADRLTAGIAAMQLWSNYNAVGYGATLAPDEAVALERARPSAVAMYAPSTEQIYSFWQSLPPQARASVPECTAVPFLGIGSPEAHVCISRLSW